MGFRPSRPRPRRPACRRRRRPLSRRCAPSQGGCSRPCPAPSGPPSRYPGSTSGPTSAKTPAHSRPASWTRQTAHISAPVPPASPATRDRECHRSGTAVRFHIHRASASPPRAPRAARPERPARRSPPASCPCSRSEIRASAQYAAAPTVPARRPRRCRSGPSRPRAFRPDQRSQRSYKRPPASYSMSILYDARCTVKPR